MQFAKIKNGQIDHKGHKNGKTTSVLERIYRPTDKEPFMNERQREYFRVKLLAWRDDILQEAEKPCNICRTRVRTIPTSPTVLPRKPTAPSSCGRAIASAS